jgi:hypothetical protein
MAGSIVSNASDVKDGGNDLLMACTCTSTIASFRESSHLTEKTSSW